VPVNCDFIEWLRHEKRFQIYDWQTEICDARGQQFLDSRRFHGWQRGKRLKDYLVLRVGEAIAHQLAHDERAALRQERILAESRKDRAF